MKSPLRIFAIICILAGFLSVFCACTESKRAYYKDQYINQQVDPYIYSTDFQRVWQEARSLLFHNGYQVKPGADPAIIETEMGIVSDNTYRRYLVTGYDYGDGRSTVHFDYYQETRNPGYNPSTSTGRDYNMEYQLIKIVENAQWNEIERAATQYANDRIAAENSK